MTIEINSLSSGFMLGLTLYRNQTGSAKKLIAQVGYTLTAVVAAIETLAALVFSALSLALYPFSSTPTQYTTQWLGSSAFSVGWSITDFCLNLFTHTLVADERSAREILDSGDLMSIPPNAWI